MGGMRREITALRIMLRLLADDEIMAAIAAGDLAAMLQMAIPIIGIAAGLITMAVGARLTATRAAIPIGQTLPGQTRMLNETGVFMGHKGETIGRPIAGKGGGGDFSVQVANLTLSRDGEDAESVGRTFAHIRAGVLSTDVPAS